MLYSTTLNAVTGGAQSSTFEQPSLSFILDVFGAVKLRQRQHGETHHTNATQHVSPLTGILWLYNHLRMQISPFLLP